ncbi:MAG TPA: AI-2E family transporter [Kofleriaceae bacterium]|nr:AI-2E family transporter [Kofleriaceae bacterium]
MDDRRSTRAPDEREPLVQVHRVDITGRTILWLLAGLAAVWLVDKLWPVVVLVLITLVLVGTLNPMVVGLERRGWRRGLAIAVVFTGLIVGVGGAVAIALPALVSQVVQILGDAPGYQTDLAAWLRHARMPDLANAVADVDLSQVALDIGRVALDRSESIMTITVGAITTLFLAAYLIADHERAVTAAYALAPRRFHLRMARILLRLETIVGGYVRGQIFTSVLMFVFVFALLTCMRAPSALALAVFAALTDALPFVGGLLGGAPVVLSALSRGPIWAIVALAAMVIYQEIESRVIVPRVYGRVLRLSSAAVMLSLVVGTSLLGVLGALLSLPIAAALRMIFGELGVPLPGDDSDDTLRRQRDAEAEAEYHRLSSGTPADEAAHIALELAEEGREQEEPQEKSSFDTR